MTVPTIWELRDMAAGSMGLAYLVDHVRGRLAEARDGDEHDVARYSEALIAALLADDDRLRELSHTRPWSSHVVTTALDELERRASLTAHERIQEAAERRRMREASPS